VLYDRANVAADRAGFEVGRDRPEELTKSM